MLLGRSIEAIGGQLAAVQMLLEAMIVDGIRTKSIDEKEFMILLDQEMDAFHNNKDITDVNRKVKRGACRGVRWGHWDSGLPAHWDACLSYS